MANLYANENFPLPAVKLLRELGHDVLTTIEAGKANQSIEDQDVLNFDTSQGRAVLTLNRKHFVRLHQSKVAHAASLCVRSIPTLSSKLAEFMTNCNTSRTWPNS